MTKLMLVKVNSIGNDKIVKLNEHFYMGLNLGLKLCVYLLMVFTISSKEKKED